MAIRPGTFGPGLVGLRWLPGYAGTGGWAGDALGGG